VNILQPGSGLAIDPTSLDMNAVSSYTSSSQRINPVDFLLNIIPTTVVDAFARGDILQVLLFSVLFGFITLAATLSAFPQIPVAGLALLLGVDRFMSEARAITNLIGNAVATMVVARWDGSLDLVRANRVLAGGVPELHDERADSISGELAALRDDTVAM
jgi:Na+/H+-dicarboxylate symporter